MEAPVNPLRRVVVIWSHGFAETAVWVGETELGRFADAALLRRGVAYSLDDKTTLRVMLMGNRLVVTRNGKPLARIGDPQPSINFGVDFLYFCALFYGIPGLLFLFLHNPDLGLGGSNILTGAVLAAIAFWASRRPLPALWVGVAAIVGRTVFGLTLPLITNADGSKFGKTVAGAVWLDPTKTSIYKFYQFWIRTDDRDVVKYLKFFTFLSQEEIGLMEKQHQENPGARAAHRALAKAVTELVHGPASTAEAMRASEILFGGELAGIPETTFNEIVGEVPTKEVARSQLDGAGTPLVEVLVHSGLSPSKGQARKDIEGGGVYINNLREPSPQRGVTATDLLFGKHLLLRKGKRNYVVVTAK